MIVVFGVGAVAATWWLGRAAYGKTAGLVAAAVVAVETIGVAYSHMAVTDVPMIALITVSLALAVTGRLEWAGVAAGLAASAKYPAVFLLVPLVVAGWGMWRRLAISAGLAVVAFLATSPYVLVHPHQAWTDATRVQRLARDGWLGFEHDSWALFSFTGKLWDGLGPVLVIAVIGLALALRRRTRTDLILAAFVLVYLVDLLTIRAHFDRYVLPLVPPLAVLAGRQRALAPLTLALLIVPLVWTIGDDVRLTRTDTRAVAHGWIVAHVPRNATVAAESSTPPLEGYRIVGLALPGPGRPFDPDRDVARLRAEGVQLRRSSRGAVADRVLAARDRYPREARFYDQLRRTRRGSTMSRPGTGSPGPGSPSTDYEKASCSSRSSPWRSRAPAPPARPRPPGRCPAAWQASWQKLANTIKAPVYCPSWLPDPLTGQIGGQLEQHQLGRQGPQLPRWASSGRRSARRSTSTCAATPA